MSGIVRNTDTGEETSFREFSEKNQVDLYAISEKKAVEFYQNVGQLSTYMVQLGQMIAAMQSRMDELEARQRQVTISHGDVKRIQQLIRIRATEICGKYQLEAEDGKAFRAAIRRDVLKRWGVKDLHDIPEAALGAVESAIGSWVNIRMVMERRKA